ncbi:MAG TPA: hypothetical protein VKD47_10515 [Miltoncostaeaceae bacterium]|nr:hypothetical protein [Miltoncostaeaceae bacterium]
MRAGPSAAALATLAALATAGCGGSSPPAPRPEAPPHFVGTAPGGLGASVDFAGFDTARAPIERALAGTRPPATLALVALVNTSSRPWPVPVFLGELADGRAVVLEPVRRTLGDRLDAAARRARSLLPVATVIPPDGSMTTYVALRGLRPSDLVGIRMRVGDASPFELRSEGP